MRRLRSVVQPSRPARRETAEPRTVRPVQPTYRRYVMPTTTAPPADSLYIAYNDFLARLAAEHVSMDDLR